MMSVAARSRLRRCVKYVVLLPCELGNTASQLVMDLFCLLFAVLFLQVVELPMLHPEKFVKLGIDPPKGVLCYGPPGTGKTLLARAVANRTDACFIRVIGSELVQKYVGEGARMVRELFQVYLGL
jgi:Cdc6-like AAA superfamily ATPase